MWPAGLTRLLKRRLIYIVLALLFLLYILTRNFNKHPRRGDLFELDDSFPERTKPLIWRTVEEHLLSDDLENRTNPPNIECRNSFQGRDLLVDDRGFVCNADYILKNACCDVQHESTKYYTCETCDPTSYCCGIYEYCVSCCLHPQKRPILELALSTITGRQAMVYTQVADQYELCLVKCRTNSHSVKHENRYRDPEHRFCYGPTAPHESQLIVS